MTLHTQKGILPLFLFVQIFFSTTIINKQIYGPPTRKQKSLSLLICSLSCLPFFWFLKTINDCPWSPRRKCFLHTYFFFDPGPLSETFFPFFLFPFLIFFFFFFNKELNTHNKPFDLLLFPQERHGVRSWTNFVLQELRCLHYLLGMFGQ